MCKFRARKFGCSHIYQQVDSLCLRAANPPRYGVCKTVDVLPPIKINTYCAPCSKRYWSQRFWQEVKDFEKTEPDEDLVLDKFNQYEEGCALLDRMCSRNEPFWSLMAYADYSAAGRVSAAVADANESSIPATTSPARRSSSPKELEISRYHLRTRQSTYHPQASNGERSRRLVEKESASDSNLMQQLFNKASKKDEEDPKNQQCLDELDADDKKASENSTPENPPRQTTQLCEELLPDWNLLMMRISLLQLDEGSAERETQYRALKEQKCRETISDD